MSPTSTDAVVEPVRAMLDADRSLAGLGITVVAAAAGHAVATMTLSSESANGHGIAHGGLVFALADTAFACAANSQASGSVTASADITYVGPAHVGEELTAEAVVRYAGERQCLVDVTVRCGSRVVAEYRGRGAKPRPRSS
jgi:acyl-CoA thioesterase